MRDEAGKTKENLFEIRVYILEVTQQIDKGI